MVTTHRTNRIHQTRCTEAFDSGHIRIGLISDCVGYHGRRAEFKFDGHPDCLGPLMAVTKRSGCRRIIVDTRKRRWHFNRDLQRLIGHDRNRHFANGIARDFDSNESRDVSVLVGNRVCEDFCAANSSSGS